MELFASAQRFMNRVVGAPLSCVILDVELPGLSGLDLQRELAEAGIAVPIIFLTGHGSIPMVHMPEENRNRAAEFYLNGICLVRAAFGGEVGKIPFFCRHLWRALAG